MVKKILGFLALAAVLAASPASAQSAPKAFEVATIKQVPPSQMTAQAIAAGRVRPGVNVAGSRVDIGFASIADLIRTSYELKPYQVEAPAWASTERYDITAKLPDGATKDDVNAMVQTLLAERFGLTFHREKKDKPVYALLVRDASKVPAADANADAAVKTDEAPLISSGGTTVSQPKQSANGVSMNMTNPETGPVKISTSPAGEHIDALSMTMTSFADLITTMLDRPAINMTNLDGPYHLTLDIGMAELMTISQRQMAQMGIQMPVAPGVGGPGAPAAGQASDPGGSSIFRTVQQMGLRLEGRNAPLDVLIVDHLERTPKED
jgi:uncharacterized protein (TIGR03435 family)